MRDHAEPKGYYDWVAWKIRQENEQEKLDFEYSLLLKLSHGGVLLDKYPDLKKIVSEVMVAERLTT